MSSSTRDKKPTVPEILVALVAVGVQLWFLLPEHKRKLVLLKVTETVRTTSSRLARRVGEQQMRAELRGDRPAYELPFFLSCLRDRAAVAYDRLRNS